MGRDRAELIWEEGPKEGMWGQSPRDCPKPSGEEAGVLGVGWGRVEATRQRKDAKSRG